jgi:hypothetical protein
MEPSILKRYQELLAEHRATKKTLGQTLPEWQMFLEFAAAYFRERVPAGPMVVEIGTLDQSQKRFYEGLLGATHIGIDINGSAQGRPDIVGDSRDPRTYAELQRRLDGRPIDLLFLDGNHTYDYVKFEFETYGALTLHLIAFHDLFETQEPGLEVGRFWLELMTKEKLHPMLTFWAHNSSKTIWPGHEMGIGLFIKGEPE